MDPITAAMVRNSRTMIDVDYAGSPLVVDHGGGVTGAAVRVPGSGIPTGHGLAEHHIASLFLELSPTRESLARLGRRWSKLVEIAHNPSVDPARAGVPAGGVIMIRPDGHIGFRFPTAEAEAFDGARPPSRLVPGSHPRCRLKRTDSSSDKVEAAGMGIIILDNTLCAGQTSNSQTHFATYFAPVDATESG